MFLSRQVWTSTHQRVSMLGGQIVNTEAAKIGTVKNRNSIHNNTEKCLQRVCVIRLAQALGAVDLVARVGVQEHIATRRHLTCRDRGTDNKEVSIKLHLMYPVVILY